MELLQAEVKSYIMDPRNDLARNSAYFNDLVEFPENSMGWMRAQLATDVDDFLKMAKSDLTWALLSAERRIMQKAIFKDCIVQIQTDVVGGIVYFPLFVQTVLAVDLDGAPIPVRSQFFEHLDNGPGMFACNGMLVDQGDEYFPGSRTTRRKYKLIANCDTTQCLNAVCKLRWLQKEPSDMMVIKNYEALRLMVQAKLLEQKEDWKNAQANQGQAFEILEKELRDYLGGIRHTVHVQTMGFGLADVGGPH